MSFTHRLLGRPRAVSLIDPWLDRHEAATGILVYGEVIEYLKDLPDFPLRRSQLRRQLQEIRPYLLRHEVCYAGRQESMIPGSTNV
jgi:hypothetical protein